MDFIEVLSSELLQKVTPRIVEAVTREITVQIKQDLVFRYSEQEAAEKLGIDKAALAKIRKAGLIEHSYSLLPSMGSDHQLHGGRVSYLPRHIQEYLERNEQKQFFPKLKAA